MFELSGWKGPYYENVFILFCLFTSVDAPVDTVVIMWWTEPEAVYVTDHVLTSAWRTGDNHSSRDFIGSHALGAVEVSTFNGKYYQLLNSKSWLLNS